MRWKFFDLWLTLKVLGGAATELMIDLQGNTAKQSKFQVAISHNLIVTIDPWL